MRLAQLCLRKLLVLFSRDDVLTHHSGHEADRPVDRSVDGRGAESPVRQRRMRESVHTGELHSTSSLRSSQAAYRHVAVLDLPVFLRMPHFAEYSQLRGHGSRASAVSMQDISAASLVFAPNAAPQQPHQPHLSAPNATSAAHDTASCEAVTPAATDSVTQTSRGARAPVATAAARNMASSALQALATVQLVPSAASEALGPAGAWLASVHSQQVKATEHAQSSAERRGARKQRGSSDHLASAHAAHGTVQTHLAAVYYSGVECMRVGAS